MGKNQSLGGSLALRMRSMVSMTSLTVKRLLGESAAWRARRGQRFLSLTTRTITCCSWSQVSVVLPSAILRVSRTTSSTRSRCLLSSQFRISASRRRQVSPRSADRAEITSLRISSSVCTSVDLQTLERMGSRSASASGRSPFSSSVRGSRRRSSSCSGRPYFSWRQRLRHLAMRSCAWRSSKQQLSSQSPSSMASKSRKMWRSCARASSPTASRKEASFCSASGLPYLTVKQLRRYSSSGACRSWMLSCRNLLSSTSTTYSSYARADTFFRGLAGRSPASCVLVSSCLIFAGDPRIAKSEVCLAVVMSFEQSCEFSSSSSRTRSSSSPVYSRLMATSRRSRAITFSRSDSAARPSARRSSSTSPALIPSTSRSCPTQCPTTPPSSAFSRPSSAATFASVQSSRRARAWRREEARMRRSSRQRARQWARSANSAVSALEKSCVSEPRRRCWYCLLRAST